MAALFLQKENIRLFSDLLNRLKKLRVPLLLSLIFFFPFFSMKLKMSENLTITYLFLVRPRLSELLFLALLWN